MEKVLEIKNICKSYKNKKVLDNFSLVLYKGEILTILGPSGRGKTTILRCINQLETIDNGKILINGEELNKNNKKVINLKIGMVFQDFNLFPHMCVLKNITFPMIKVLKYNKEKAKNKALEILKKLNMEDKKFSYPYQLSGGEKQRVAIARVIGLKNTIICFDEPTSALDNNLINQLYIIMKKLTNQGKSIILVTHDIKFANKISDRIIQL